MKANPIRFTILVILLGIGIVMVFVVMSLDGAGVDAGILPNEDAGNGLLFTNPITTFLPIVANRIGGEVVVTSQVVTSTMHGFDSCYFPTVEQMQTWWDESPYYVRNIYLGGINHGCSTADLTAEWVQAVAQQGWQFILTWVGLQPPCSNYSHKFSNNYLTAYAEGINEAAAALEVADSIGLSGEKIIYNDLEIYDGTDPICNLAVTYFVRGWTDWLHNTGNKAGVYAAPCYSNSNMTDWWDYNNPPPDDVWLAHWLHKSGYDPTASVWSPCLADTYWPGYRRLRQYSGDHVETWGGVAIPIDSNILNGEVVSVTVTVSTTTATASKQGGERSQIWAMDLITPQEGWILRGNQLFWTIDGGENWEEITPKILEGLLLEVDFYNAARGWAVVLQIEAGRESTLIYQTGDGGESWTESSKLAIDEAARDLSGIAGAHLDFLDEKNGFLVLKQQSGSSFSQGWLFATKDGGMTWEERSAPMGESVVFRDPQEGWMTGGATQDRIFRTRDGGMSWQMQRLTGLTEGKAFVGEVQFDPSGEGILPVTVLGDKESWLVLYRIRAVEGHWTRSESVTLPAGYEPGSRLPFSQHEGRWWSGMPSSSRLYRSAAAGQRATALSPNGLPAGLMSLDFADEESGWALVQQGICYGDKEAAIQTAWGSDPFSCIQATHLYKTVDGGNSWREIWVE